jgi:succinate-semialdehyde dehydrogenase/glutarate-semialdehyde dehydrogenase
LQIVEEQVAEALAAGAKLICGGKRLPELGEHFYAPTILANVTHQMRLMREETFGPVLPVMAFDTEEQAIQLANDSEFGLAASVWTRDRKRGERLARQLRAGTVMVNDVVSCFGVSEAPHGGVRWSGNGRTHGRAGLEEMTTLQYIDSDLAPGMKKVWWYGYGGDFAQQIERFTDFLFAPGWWTRLTSGLRSTAALWRKRL